MDSVYIKIIGVDDLATQLAALPNKLRARALARILRKAARPVRDLARKRAPVLRSSHPAALAGRRKPGTLRRAISVRTSKDAKRQGDVGVFINVRPLDKKRRKGKNDPNDPFYWRWVEFGWTPASRANGGRGRRGVQLRRKSQAAASTGGTKFLTRSAEALPQVLTEFSKEFGPVVRKLNVRNAPAPT